MSVNCPLCRQPAGRTIPAAISEFLIVRCGLPQDVHAQSHLCQVCEHVFFTPFLSPENLRSLYEGYRGAEYNAQRISIEPGYRDIVDWFVSPDSEHDRIRNAFYDFALCEYKHLAGSVVDFGGGDGHFSRRIFPSAVVQVVEEDFERNGGDLPAVLGGAELLFCAHVFEHIPQPVELLTSLVRFLQPGKRVWLEVPLEYQGNLTAAYDAAGGGLNGTAITLMHEHIAHFSRRSLKSLANRSGLSVEEIIVSNHGLMAAICHRA
jgi:hypothetical protein